MLPEPLHPVLVHFPIVLTTLLLPVGVLAAIASYRRPGRRPWLPMVALASLTLGAALIAQQAGEREEDRVEPWVGETAIEHHEERAARFVWSLGAVFGLSLVGFVSGGVGRAARWLTVAAVLPAAASLFLVGESGGDLVYKHGAAAAYAESPPGQPVPGEPRAATVAEPSPPSSSAATDPRASQEAYIGAKPASP